MRSPARTLAIALVALFSLGSCMSRASSVDDDAEAPQVARGETIALRLERAERSLDVGRDVATARSSLEALLADPSLISEQRDQARFALSRAFEATGDGEMAVRVLEDLLADHPSRERFPLEEIAQARLRTLLLGTETRPAELEDATPAAAFARALASQLQASSGKPPVDLEILAFGGSAEVSARLGTFALGRAFRDLRRKECPVCDDTIGVGVHLTRMASWLSLARERARLGTSLAVVYFDLGANRVPARYDAYLPMPSAEIAARLSRGEGLIAVRERPGAPPVVLLAAPRTGELAEVEEAAAALDRAPTDPVVVSLKHGLRPQEIQTIVRASFGGYRACYEQLLTSAPSASGTARVHFAIRPDGAVDSIKIDADAGLTGAGNGSFPSCLEGATRRLAFPATGVGTTVIYPIVFTPG